MNRKIITGLIILMGISLIGIIAVQLVWISNAVEEREVQFVNNVNQALENVSAKAEKAETLHFVSNMIDNNKKETSRNENLSSEKKSGEKKNTK